MSLMSAGTVGGGGVSQSPRNGTVLSSTRSLRFCVLLPLVSGNRFTSERARENDIWTWAGQPPPVVFCRGAPPGAVGRDAPAVQRPPPPLAVWGGGGGGAAVECFGGTNWPIATDCPALGPSPFTSGGAPRPLTPPVSFLSLLGLSFPLYFPFFPPPGGGGWHKALVSGCLPLAAPIGLSLSPLLILTLCGSERVLVVCVGGGGGWGGGGGVVL